jgi:hypothetical protein
MDNDRFFLIVLMKTQILSPFLSSNVKETFLFNFILSLLQVYQFRSKDGCFVRLQSEWKSFRNPWTKDVEYLVAKNGVVL